MTRTGIALFLLLALGGCAGKPVLPGVNLILITIDTLRADHLGCYGYPRIKTPHIDRLAREGVLFSSGFSSVPLTLPSHTTFLTGLFPSHHGVHDNGAYTLADEHATIAEYLSDAGYQTAAIVSSFQLNGRYGIDQGFDHYDDKIPREYDLYDKRLITGPKSQNLRFESEQRRAEDITKLTAEWLEKKDDSPFFLWLHYFDPHGVYDPPPPFSLLYDDRTYPDSLYDGEITYLDHHIGLLRRLLEDAGLYDNTLIVFTADHGEGLGEHKEWYHDQFIYDATTHVPFIFGGGAVPEIWPALVTESVRSVDVLPTLVHTIGLKSESEVQGRSLIPVLLGKSDGEQPQYVESYSPTHNLCVKLFGIRHNGWKYIEAPTPELYNIEEDPGETQNIAGRYPDMATEMRELLQPFMPEEEGLPDAIDFDTRKKLEAIGYIQRTQRRVSMASRNEADPKDMAACVEGLHMSMRYFTFGRYDSSLAVSLRLKDIFPGQTRIYDNIGNLQIRLGLYEDAIKEFKIITTEQPRYAKGNFWIGMAHMRLRHEEDALRWLRKGLAIDPKLSIARYNLAVILARNRKLDEALEHWDQVIATDPKSNFAKLSQTAATDVRRAIQEAKKQGTRIDITVDPEL